MPVAMPAATMSGLPSRFKSAATIEVLKKNEPLRLMLVEVPKNPVPSLNRTEILAVEMRNGNILITVKVKIRKSERGRRGVGNVSKSDSKFAVSESPDQRKCIRGS